MGIIILIVTILALDLHLLGFCEMELVAKILLHL